MEQIITDKSSQKYLFANQKDFDNYKQYKHLSNLVITNNQLRSQKQVISKLVPVQHIAEAVSHINRLSLEEQRKMPSAGWLFILYKDKDGFLKEEFTKKEWLKANIEYVGVSFQVASAFERNGAKTLVSYFQSGGLLETIAPNVYYYYDRLFAKYGNKPAVFCIEDVPDLEDFMKTYMPMLYKDLLETATYELIENFDPQKYVDRIINNHYTYK